MRLSFCPKKSLKMEAASWLSVVPVNTNAMWPIACMISRDSFYSVARNRLPDHTAVIKQAGLGIRPFRPAKLPVLELWLNIRVRRGQSQGCFLFKEWNLHTQGCGSQ